ncbi:MAG: tyrosine--tRNA ligase [Gemmatimonadales bacterium]
MTTLLEVLTERRLVQEATPGLAARLARGPITGYAGFDPTADSLHVGNLVPVMALAWLQRTGGSPIALVGGATGLVGDPSGKRSERPLLDPATVAANAAAIRTQLSRFLDFDGPSPAMMANNAEWLGGLGLLDFLRDAGKHFTIGWMLQKESVRSRLEGGISLTEFVYMALQAYDFAHLRRTRGCELQVGGSDQWGNITAGIELIGKRDGGEAHGLVLPLLTTASGTKFGKTEAGNIWLDPARTSPYQFYQFWLNADDRDADRLLRTFTFLPLPEIAGTMRAQAADPAARSAQRLLADELTARVHGTEVLRRVREASRLLFGADDIAGATAEVLEVIAGEVPTSALDPEALARGLPIADALVSAGLATSKADARRGIQQQGFSVNGIRLAEADRRLTAGDLLHGRYVVLQKGRKNYAMLEVRK